MISGVRADCFGNVNTRLELASNKVSDRVDWMFDFKAASKRRSEDLKLKSDDFGSQSDRLPFWWTVANRTDPLSQSNKVDLKN